MKKLILILIIYLVSTINANAEFSFTFEWGDIKKCTSGNPNKVENPIFNLVNVPEGTKELRFKMKDKDVPQYNHGGGKIKISCEFFMCLFPFSILFFPILVSP